MKRKSQLKEEKQEGRCLMADAPERKQKRKSSPPRGPCPLILGTPETPPPCEFQMWQKRRNRELASMVVPSVKEEPDSPDMDDVTSTIDIKEEPIIREVEVTPQQNEREIFIPKRYSPQPGSSGLQRPMRHPEPDPLGVNVACTIDPLNEETLIKEEEVTPQLEKCKHIFDSPSKRIRTTERLTGDFDIDNNVEKKPNGFTPDQGDDDVEQQLLQLEQHVQKDVGSDVDDDDIDESDFSESKTRNASEFPANTEDVLSSNVFSELTDLDAQDDSALKAVATDTMLHFDWCKDRNIFKGQREVFTAQAGPTFPTEGLSPSDIFFKIWDAKIIDDIARETNRYANELVNDPKSPRYSRMRKWTDITREELWVFLSIMMLQGIVPLPVEKEYWYPNLPYLKLGNFSDIMSYSKFLLIKKCLHFVDNNNLSRVSKEDKKLQKIRPIIDHLNERFSSLYQPEQEIAIDESLLLWKGRLSFAQLISNKTAKVGIKSYELCESKSGYLWKMIIYTGKIKEPEQQESAEEGASTEPKGATSRIVYNLVRPLLDKGYTLVMDNFYNSPLLSRMLKARKTDTMGTLRLSREFVPRTLRDKSKTKMRTGEVAFSQTEDILIVLWKDANVVSLISTYHKMEVDVKKKHIVYKYYKPGVVSDYNLYMGGVDKKDQMLQAFPIERVRNTVWYKKLFRRLFNVSIHNTFVLFANKNRIQHRQFRLQLVDELLKKFHMLKASPRVTRVLAKSLPNSNHFPEKVTVGRPRCKLCQLKKRDSRTQWQCDTCLVSLCLIGCFKEYHILA